MGTLPPHFLVWLLYMHMSGQATPIAGFQDRSDVRADPRRYGCEGERHSEVQVRQVRHREVSHALLLRL